jgi:hypothetical protein
LDIGHRMRYISAAIITMMMEMLAG